jgi:hypothetical protein
MARDTEWHFGPFRVEEGNERLWRGTEPIRLRPKSFAVLCYLLARAGRLVTKAELLQTVWPEVVVSEAMLTICISELRRALGETRQAPACIETVPRRGAIGSWLQSRWSARQSQRLPLQRPLSSVRPPPDRCSWAEKRRSHSCGAGGHGRSRGNGRSCS